MDYADAQTLWQAITVLEARDYLWALKVAIFPYDKKEARAKLQRELHDKAYPNAEVREITWGDLAELTGQKGVKAEDGRPTASNRDQARGRDVQKGVRKPRK